MTVCLPLYIRPVESWIYSLLHGVSVPPVPTQHESPSLGYKLKPVTEQV